MSIYIGDNFKYLGKKFLDDRESFSTLEKMKLCEDVPDGFITYCKEDDKRYEFKSSNNIDETTGKWAEFVVNSVGGGNSYVGVEEPEDENAIWFYDSITDGSSHIQYDNPLISELFSCISELKGQIKKLQEDVEYLMINGSKPSTPSNPSNPNSSLLTLEEGGLFILEDGGYIELESKVELIDKNRLLLEDGAKLLLENKSDILLEM